MTKFSDNDIEIEHPLLSIHVRPKVPLPNELIKEIKYFFSRKWIFANKSAGFLFSGKTDSPSGSKLHFQRQRRNLSQRELSRLSGVSQAKISNLENNHLKMSLHLAKKLSNGLGCHFSQLIEG